jgi:hypothetical protein
MRVRPDFEPEPLIPTDRPPLARVVSDRLCPERESAFPFRAARSPGSRCICFSLPTHREICLSAVSCGRPGAGHRGHLFVPPRGRRWWWFRRAAAGPAPGTGGGTEEVPRAGPGGGPSPDPSRRVGRGASSAARRRVMTTRPTAAIRLQPFIATPLTAGAVTRRPYGPLRMKRGTSANLSTVREKFLGWTGVASRCRAPHPLRHTRQTAAVPYSGATCLPRTPS